jgi:hypothetical protein
MLPTMKHLDIHHHIVNIFRCSFTYQTLCWLHVMTCSALYRLLYLYNYKHCWTTYNYCWTCRKHIAVLLDLHNAWLYILCYICNIAMQNFSNDVINSLEWIWTFKQCICKDLPRICIQYFMKWLLFMLEYVK